MTRNTLSIVAAGLLTVASAALTTHAKTGDAIHSRTASASTMSSPSGCGNYDYSQTYDGYNTDDDAHADGQWHLIHDANATGYTTNEAADGSWTLVVWYRI